MIGPVGFNAASQAITALIGTSTSSAASQAPSVTGSPGDSATISGPAQLLSELQQLATQNPAKFKTVTADIATKLQTAADGIGGTPATGTSPLTDLAAKFQQASETGDVSALKPPSHSHHHHGIGTYNQQGQVQPTSDTTTGTDLKALFTSISTEVSTALSS